MQQSSMKLSVQSMHEGVILGKNRQIMNEKKVSKHFLIHWKLWVEAQNRINKFFLDKI